MAVRALRLVAVLCDGEPCGFAISVSAGVGDIELRFPDLCTRGHADLAFDFACDALRRRKAITALEKPRARGTVRNRVRAAPGIVADPDT